MRNDFINFSEAYPQTHKAVTTLCRDNATFSTLTGEQKAKLCAAALEDLERDGDDVIYTNLKKLFEFVETNQIEKVIELRATLLEQVWKRMEINFEEIFDEVSAWEQFWQLPIDFDRFQRNPEFI